MKKYNFLLILIIFMPVFITPAINQGYFELDKLFGFPIGDLKRECDACNRAKCNKAACKPKKFACNKPLCSWSKIFTILTNYGIDPNTYYSKIPERETLFQLAIRTGNIKAMRTLVNSYKMNIVQKDLMKAVQHNQKEALKFLLSYGIIPTVETIRLAYDLKRQWAVNMFAQYGIKRTR